MKDIEFRIDNIFTDTLITNSIKYGSGGEYSINILKAGSRGNRTNLSFNTAIKATPGAQGGQAPIEYVLKRMKNNGKKKLHLLMIIKIILQQMLSYLRIKQN